MDSSASSRSRRSIRPAASPPERAARRRGRRAPPPPGARREDETRAREKTRASSSSPSSPNPLVLFLPASARRALHPPQHPAESPPPIPSCAVLGHRGSPASTTPRHNRTQDDVEGGDYCNPHPPTHPHPQGMFLSFLRCVFVFDAKPSDALRQPRGSLIPKHPVVFLHGLVSSKFAKFRRICASLTERPTVATTSKSTPVKTSLLSGKRQGR